MSSVLVSNGYPSSFVQKITKTRTAPRRGPVREFKCTTVLLYVQGKSAPLHCCLKQQDICTNFKSDMTVWLNFVVWPKDTINPTKQDCIVYRIPCNCGRVYIRERGRPIQERIKEHDRDIRHTPTWTSAISEHIHKTSHYPIWNNVKFIDQDPHWYTYRVKEAIHIRLHPANSMNRDSGIEIPEAWMPLIKNTTTGKWYNSEPLREQLLSRTTEQWKDWNAPITATLVI